MAAAPEGDLITGRLSVVLEPVIGQDAVERPVTAVGTAYGRVHPVDHLLGELQEAEG